ncbi:hypothetical protein PVAP13_2KG430005 [Panicum virgatum]|uniref:Uncharacterized protein n=1 Tax=Panicum virgatum TaxID=38727 RepID=A0A8T0WI67_PANVG|nr:hypothetical protein PVAP13_2KG430005 [Panicum virgatum]
MASASPSGPPPRPRALRTRGRAARQEENLKGAGAIEAMRPQTLPLVVHWCPAGRRARPSRRVVPGHGRHGASARAGQDPLPVPTRTYSAYAGQDAPVCTLYAYHER